jgi:hypothetical protein
MSQQRQLNRVVEANHRLRHTHQEERQRDVIDRLRQLQVILPAMALEAAVAKRDAARLRRENAQLLRQLSGRRESQPKNGAAVSHRAGL